MLLHVKDLHFHQRSHENQCISCYDPSQLSSISRETNRTAVSTTPDPDLWAEKPWWCQPWTILLTGVLAISGSWLVLHRLWITIPVAAMVLAWWVLFLVIAPAAYRNQPR